MPAVTGNNFYIDSHDLHFRTGTTNVATINYDTSDESISLNVAGTGVINIGDAGGDIYIGDGTTQSDIIFEQNGAIRGLTNKTLTLGQTDSNVTIAAQNFTISGTGVVTDMSGKLEVQNVDVGGLASWAGIDNQAGAIFMSSNGRGLLGAFSSSYARPLITANSNYIELGSAGTSLIYGSKIYAGNASSTVGTHNFYTSGTNLRMHIAKDGNVGIGTDSPSARLHVNGPSAGFAEALRLQRAGGNYYSVGLDNSRVNFVYNSQTTANSALVIDGPNTRVGIGTHVPQKALDVYGKIKLSQASSEYIVSDGSIRIDIDNDNDQTDRIFVVSKDNAATELMRVQEDGNVGIGVGDPDATLEVKGAGNTDATSSFVVRDSDDAVLLKARNDGVVTVEHNYFYVNSSAGAYVQNNFRVRGSLFNDQGTLQIGNSSGTAFDGDVNFDANTLFVDSSTNRIGIGTATPDKQLHISHATQPYLRLEESDSGGEKRLDLFVSSSTGVIGANQSAQTMMFQTVGETRMTIASDGDVGIGTTNPTYRLHVNSDGTNQIARFQSTDNDAVIGIADNTDAVFIGHDAALDVMSLGFDSSMGVSSNLNIDTAGSVGIGTNDPTSKLHVKGPINITRTVNTDTSNIDMEGNFRFIANNGYRTTFFNNGVERVRFDVNGNVGIGTNSPDNRLHVETSDNEVAKFESTDAKGYIEIKDNTYSSYVGINSTAGAASFGGKVDGAADTGNLNISTINGKVGIGTTSFSEQLGVKPDTDVSAEIGKAHVGYIGFADYAGFSHVDRNSTSDYALLQSAGGSTFLNKANGYEIYFRNNNNTIGGFNTANDFYVETDTLYVDISEDSVGINTSSPGEALDVVGFIRMGNATANSTQKIARQVVRAYNTSHNDFMAFMGTANQTSNVVSYGGGSADQTCATKLAFYTHTDVSTSTAGTQRMHINSIGKVGIGAATSFSTDHAGMKLQICAEDTSPSLNTTAIDDCSLVISNEDEDYGTVFAVKGNGIGQIQQRRMSAATYYSLELQPFGGNVGVGTESPSDKLQVNGSFSASSKTFNIEHPTQSGKRLIHGCFEGPEHGVYFRGKTQDSGIQAPEYWSGLVDIDSMTVDVTPIGPNQSIYVDRIEDNGDVYVGANTDEPLNYFYIIYGERKDIDKLEVVKDNPPPDTGIA